MSAEFTKMKILITGGRAPVALDLARNLRASGHVIYVAESLSANLCKYSNAVEKCFAVPGPNVDESGFVAKIIRLMNAYQIDVVIPTCEETFYISKNKEQIERSTKGRVLTDDFGKLKVLHNKFEFIELVKTLGFSVPPTFMVRSGDELQRVAGSQFGQAERLVLKPVYSRFGSSVKIFENTEAGRKKIKFKKAEEGCRAHVVQKFIDGRQICTYAVCSNGRVLAYAAYTSSFRTGVGASINFEAVGDAGIREWVERIVDKLDFSGQISFDLIQDENGVIFPIECNPRATSGLHLLSGKNALQDTFLYGDCRSIAAVEGERAMLMLPMLLFGPLGIRGLKDVRKWFRVMTGSREIAFDFRDLKPFWFQSLAFFQLMGIAIRNGVSITEASTLDIEWNGDL